MDDLRNRLTNRVQITMDGHRAYLEAVEGAFGGDVDYAQVIKMYGATPSPAGRYSPAECNGIQKRRVEGNPDDRHVSTSYVEVHNKTMRMHMRRFTRLTNGHSKKVANHVHMVALYTLFYNFIRTHGKLRITPAMAAGIADTFMSFEDVLARIDAAQAPKARGPYKMRATPNGCSAWKRVQLSPAAGPCDYLPIFVTNLGSAPRRTECRAP